MTAALAFFTGGIGRWVALAAALIFVIFMARMHWIQEGREEIIQANVATATRIITKQGEITQKIVYKYRDRAAQTDAVAKATEEGVNNYAKQNPTGMCIDSDFLRLLDRATGTVPDTTPGPNGTVPAPTTHSTQSDSQGRALYGDSELRTPPEVRGYIRRPAGLDQATG